MALPDISENSRTIGAEVWYVDGNEIVGLTTAETFRISTDGLQNKIDNFHLNANKCQSILDAYEG